MRQNRAKPWRGTWFGMGADISGVLGVYQALQGRGFRGMAGAIDGGISSGGEQRVQAGEGI